MKFDPALVDNFNETVEIRQQLKAISHGMFSIYVFGAYVENISSELGYALLFLSTCGKHTK